MNQAALLRRLKRHQGSVLSPRAQLQLEIDHRRDNLAERLLEILAEDSVGHDLVALAENALAAAEIIHPDLQEEVLDA